MTAGSDFGDCQLVNTLTHVHGRRIKVGPLEFDALEAGTGTPLLILHGFTGAKEDFSDWIDRIADLGFHVVVPDQRGHGRSSKPSNEDDYSLEIFASDARSLIAELGWDRTVLIGHSMGGMIAQTLALEAPELLSNLVLMSTHYGPFEPVESDLLDLAVALARSDGTGAIADVMAEMDEDPFQSDAKKRVRLERPELEEMGERSLRAASSAMYAKMILEMTHQSDRLEQLSSLYLPALVIAGEQDKTMLTASEEIASSLSCAEFEVIRDAGHSPHFENPSAFWAALGPFLVAHVSGG